MTHCLEACSTFISHSQDSNSGKRDVLKRPYINVSNARSAGLVTACLVTALVKMLSHRLKHTLFQPKRINRFVSRWWCPFNCTTMPIRRIKVHLKPIDSMHKYLFELKTWHLHHVDTYKNMAVIYLIFGWPSSSLSHTITYSCAYSWMISVPCFT